jgi:hypothetical protein
MGFLLWPGSGSAPCCNNCGGAPVPVPCGNCLSGQAPRKLKLVVPLGTFVAADGSPCTDSGCDFYAGTYLFDMLGAPQTSGCDDADGLCCNWFLCFDGPASFPDCDCGLEQSADCKAFCVVNINVLPPDGADEHYKVVVEFTSGGAEETICGDCHFVTGRTIFQKDYGVDDDGRPDCLDWNNEAIPLAITFGDYCKAADGAVVYLTAI